MRHVWRMRFFYRLGKPRQERGAVRQPGQFVMMGIVGDLPLSGAMRRDILEHHDAADHLTIGEGARIAAQSGLMHDVPPGAQWMGYPAGSARDFFREVAVLKRLARGETAASPRRRPRSLDETK